MIQRVQASTDDSAVHASGAAAVITYAAVTENSAPSRVAGQHVIYGVAWSYDADPTGGGLQIEDGSGNTVFLIDITKGGPGFIPFARFGWHSLAGP